MNFSELETLMSSRGVTTLAELARVLNTTPQAVSNWKSRNQVPHHIVAKLNKSSPPIADNPQTPDGSPVYSSPSIFEEDTISLSDILLTIAKQLKVIVITTIITVFITFTHVQFNKELVYKSSSTILLSENKSIPAGISGLASQFGIGMASSGNADLSSPSLFPELIISRTFAERVLNNSFYTDKFGVELPLLAILTKNNETLYSNQDTLIQQALGRFQGMITFENQGSFSVLTTKAFEPKFARDLNKIVLDELIKLNRFYKNQNVNEKLDFIDNRIKSVEDDLIDSEQKLRIFREKNRQLSSPALILGHERLTREVEIQKGVFLTLKQQLELAKIEEIQEASIVQVLDGPQIPLDAESKNMKLSLLLSGLFGLGIGIIFGFIRSYLDNDDMYERRKLRKIKLFIKKKRKDIFYDRRVSGILSILFIIGLPYYLGHKSKNPVYFGLYSEKLMLVNTFYLITLIFFITLFIYLSIRGKNNK